MIINEFHIKEISNLSRYKKVKTIGRANRKHFIYKYFNAERAIEFINKGEIVNST